MNAYSPRAAAIVLVLGTLRAGLSAAPTWPQAEVPVKVTIALGGRTDTLRGTGQCGHEPRASIYGIDAALWTADYRGGAHQVTLSYWRPVGGAGDQFSLSVRRGSTDHRISTVKGGRLEGSGRSTFRPTAVGGRFEISGKDQTGAALSATIECARFGSISAVGG